MVISEKMIASPVIPPGASPVDWKMQLTARAVSRAETVIQA